MEYRTEKKMEIYLHADDYGMNMESSRRILECFTNGGLQGVSIMANSFCLKETAKLADGYALKLRVHLNLVEGRCVSRKEEVSLLVNEQGYFCHSFLGIYFLTLSAKRKEVRRQIKRELENQIKRVSETVGMEKLSIDSHQHTLMIPAVFHLLCEIVKEKKFSIESLRISAEPILPFVRHISLWRTYSPVNMIKNWLLNIMYLFIHRDIKDIGAKKNVFMGIMFSGHMDEKRILKVLPDFCRIARRRHTYVEILFHPGYLRKGEALMDVRKKQFLKFYFCENRKVDEATLKSKSFYHAVEHLME